MCGRFTLAVDPTKLMEALPGFTVPHELTLRYNIAPSQELAVIVNNGQNKVEFFRWGLISSWAKDPRIGNRMINARAKTVAEKRSFHNAFRRRRRLILADGFYEWWEEPGRGAKTPMDIRLKSGEPFAFVGLREAWRPADDQTVLVD